MNIFIYSDLSEPLRFRIQAALKGDLLHFYDRYTSEPPPLENFDVLFGNPPKKWVNNMSNLKFWQLDSAGFDQYKEISTAAIVANMGDFFSLKCAETIVGGILGNFRGIPGLAKLQVQKKWVGRPLRYEMDLLSEKKVIILGAGTIALAIKKILSGFSCDVKLTARKSPQADIHDEKKLFAELPLCDIVINTLPGGAGKLVSKEFIGAMKPTAVYASIGRGSTTDEHALIEALQSGKIGGAVLDVTQSEPLPISSPLWEMSNVLLTQHTGGGHKLEDEGKTDMFLKNMTRYKQGERILNQIDLSKGY